MSLPVIEIVTIPLQPDVTVEDQASQAGKEWKAAIEQLSCVAGCQRIYFSRYVEDKNKLQMFVDWESIEHHHKSTADPSYAKFTKRLASFLNGRPTFYHATLDPPQPAATFGSPTVEMYTAYFPAATRAAEKESWEQRFKKFLTIMPGAQGYKAHATGWVVEEVIHEEIEGKAAAWVTAIGWESVEAHKAFRETELFKKNVEPLREGPTASEMHHLDFGALR